MLKTIKITDSFFLNERTIKQPSVEPQVKPKPIPVNHIVNIDVSGSMSWDLTEIRKQLKNKLPNLVKENDTISIVWFSGNREAGILKEEVEIKSLTSLKELNDAIDRFLKPVGLTAFAKPLELTKEIIDRIKVKRPNTLFNLLFMTDGGNNDCSWSEVQKALSNLTKDVSSATFIEYGLYADSNRLTQMAETIGGEKILANSFDEYDVIFEEKISKNLKSSKKVTVDIQDSKHSFCFNINDENEIIVYSINDSQILVNDDVEKVYFFSSEKLTDKIIDTHSIDLPKILYSSIFVLSDRTLNNDVEVLYTLLGDKYTFDMFTNSFGKQKLNQFKSYIKECIFDESKRFIEGEHQNLVLDENAFCFLDLIEILSSDENNLFYPNHQDFNYKRIGAKKVFAGNKISKELQEKMTICETIEELKTLIEEESKNSVGELKFTNTDINKGFPLTDLVWNESKCNLSVRCRMQGYVELPKNQFGIDKVDTFVYRTYTIVKDGILNLTKLPVSLTDETLSKLSKATNSVVMTFDGFKQIIDFSKLPIINRSMVKEVSAEKLANLEFELLKLQGNKKGYDYFEKLLFPKKSEEFIKLYSEEAEAWLKENGITSFNGFAPKTTNAESTDFYMSVVLESKVAGFSSLPKVQDVITKIEGNKPLKPNEALLKPSIEDYNNQIKSDLYLSQDKKTQDKILEKWLRTNKTKFLTEKRKVMNEIAKIKFGLILSKGWFKEFSSFDENTITLNIDGSDIKFTFELKDEQVNI